MLRFLNWKSTVYKRLRTSFRDIHCRLWWAGCYAVSGPHCCATVTRSRSTETRDVVKVAAAPRDPCEKAAKVHLRPDAVAYVCPVSLRTTRSTNCTLQGRVLHTAVSMPRIDILVLAAVLLLASSAEGAAPVIDTYVKEYMVIRVGEAKERKKNGREGSEEKRREKEEAKTGNEMR